MTFNVVQNADTYYNTAYMALLGNVVYYLISQPQSQWREDMIKLAVSTYKITSENLPIYQDYVKTLKEQPA